MTPPSKPSTVGVIGATLKKVRAGDAHHRLDGNDLQQINRVVVPVVVIALGAALSVGWRAGAIGPVLLWVFAAMAAGGATGFLFGIPKSGLPARTDAGAPAAPPAVAGSSATGSSPAPRVASALEPAPRARPNTNLEEVSDWLTKILVGLTLVNLKDLKDEVRGICANAAAAIHPQPTAADVSTATALVVGFALLGFLAVYIYMRLFVQGAIVRSDGQMNRYLHAVDFAERIGEVEPSPAPDLEADPQPVVPSAASLSAAQAVADVAPADPDVVLQPLRQLGSEYESLRGQRDYGPERTRLMTEIVRRMRPHAIAAAPYIGELIRSASTGEHLAATVILQMKYMPEHMAWLARRLVEERSFIGYQAASALLARVRVAGPAECRALQDAVRQAKADRASSGSAEATLDRLIDQILAAQ